MLDRAGGEFSVHGEVSSPFQGLVEIMGIQNAMIGLLTDPGKCHELLSRFLERSFIIAREQVKTGIDALKISSPYAGKGFISRNFYKKYFLFYEYELVKKIHEFKPGFPVYMHTCGAISDRLELMTESGIDGIECLDPPPLGDCELADAKKRIGELVFIKGNMDSVNVLLRATPESMDGYVQQQIADGAAGGGYILSTACSVAPGVKPEVLETLVPLAEKYGKY
jgi:uroporphyrinogen decarboxylase